MNILMPTYHPNFYRLNMPDIQVPNAEHVGLSGLALTQICCPKARMVEVQNCQLKHLSSVRTGTECLFIIVDSDLSADCLCQGAEIENILLDKNAYQDNALKLPVGCRCLSVVGEAPACLDFSACSVLRYLDFSSPQQGKIILPPRVSPNLKKIVQRYYPNPEQIETAATASPVSKGVNRLSRKQKEK